MATTHASLFLRVFRCFVFLLVLNLLPTTAAQAQHVGMDGCCYEFRRYHRQEVVGHCIWLCDEEGEPRIAITDIVCDHDVMEWIGCRDPENSPPCPEAVYSGNLVVGLDCDQFGQVYWSHSCFCYPFMPWQYFPLGFTNCEEVDCEIPLPGNYQATPTYEECEEKGCCSLET